MGLFKEIATPLVSRSVPVIPLRPKTKIAFIKGWENQATTDVKKVEEWDEQYNESNAACVAYARPEGVWFFEIDNPEIWSKIGQKLPATFMVRSGPKNSGRGHLYFQQTPASIAMGNAQAKDSNGKELWSARVDNRYVVAPGSFHPSGHRYEIVQDVPIIPAPDWLVQWCSSNKTADIDAPRRTGVVELDDDSPIVEGGRNNAITSILGKARQVIGMQADELYAYGLVVNEKRCRPPLSDNEIKTIAYSIGKYAVAPPAPPVVMGGYAKPEIEELQQPIHVEAVPYPIFPRWVIKGTSLGDHLVAPILEKNNSYPEFIFMPAMVLMLNYVAQKVQVKDRKIIPNMYLLSIGWKGRAYKSSGVIAAVEHLNTAGMVDNGLNVRAAEGKSLVFTAASTEGLGLEMTRTNCKNAVLYYDEFKLLVDKASIEKSSMLSHLLILYDGATFANTKSSRREQFSHPAGQYCASLIANCADKAFPKLWGKIPDSKESGWDDRFFFLFQPETQKPWKPEIYVNTSAGAVETRKLMDKAIKQKIYEISDPEMFEEEVNKLGDIGSRYAKLIEKLSLYFAIDLGKDEIDESCIERAVAIVKYGLATKKYLRSFESETREGGLQQEILRLLRFNGGAIKERDFLRSVHPERYGTSMWNKAYHGLIHNGWIREDGDGKKGNPKQIVLLNMPEEE